MPAPIPFCFAFASSFTVEPIEPAIRFWSGPLHSEFATAFAPFGQILQTLLDPASVFGKNRHGLNVLLFRRQDLGERADNFEVLKAAIASRAPQLQAPLLVVSDEDIPGALLLTSSRIDAWYPVRQRDSAEGERLGAVPYTEEYFVALGSAIVRAAHAIHHAPYKVLALDCDNTLWRGICGEDGPEGVSLTPGHRALQDFAVRQREAGMLLALSSKNNLEDAQESFACHPEFPLQWSDITAHRIDWNPKPDGLKSIAAELSLSLDSFVFLDDNPREVFEVDEQLPQVLSLTLPENSSDFSAFLDHVWAFDRMQVTSEDAGRAASYRSVQEFGKALHTAHSLEDFYRTLDLEVTIRPVAEEEWARAAQLTQRTNQFNLTTIRRSEAELRSIAWAGVEVFGIHVRDRFGEYGFAGLLIGSPFQAEYAVENFLLSCRVLGRGVEHAVVVWLSGQARKLGRETVSLPFVESARNLPAAKFLGSLGCNSFPARIAVDDLANVKIDSRTEPSSGKLIEALNVPAQHEVDYALIARELRTVSAIRSRMRKGGALQLATGTETSLATIWRDLLHAETIQGASSFFDLGGHSLMVVLLLMRVQEEFGVTLGIDDVYAADVTLEKMARRIDELVCFGGVGHDEYAQILASVEALTEEEAEAALDADSISR